MTYRNIHREEAQGVGEDGADVSELHGVAPPCKRCGSRERVESGLCSECLDDVEEWDVADEVPTCSECGSREAGAVLDDGREVCGPCGERIVSEEVEER